LLIGGGDREAPALNRAAWDRLPISKKLAIPASAGIEGPTESGRIDPGDRI
jgi:hypothetical protein